MCRNVRRCASPLGPARLLFLSHPNVVLTLLLSRSHAIMVGAINLWHFAIQYWSPPDASDCNMWVSEIPSGTVGCRRFSRCPPLLLLLLLLLPLLQLCITYPTCSEPWRTDHPSFSRQRAVRPASPPSVPAGPEVGRAAEDAGINDVAKSPLATALGTVA